MNWHWVIIAMLFGCGGKDIGTPIDGDPSIDAPPLIDGNPITNDRLCFTGEDCGNNPCIEVVDGGWKACFFEIGETDAPSGSPDDECVNSSECTQPNGCYEVQQCGLIGAQNQCITHECDHDIDCTAQPNGVCVPAGTFLSPINKCHYGGCRFDLDCTEREGGRCYPFFDPCTAQLFAYHCLYEDAPCRLDEDCDTEKGEYCEHVGNGNTQCSLFTPPI